MEKLFKFDTIGYPVFGGRQTDKIGSPHAPLHADSSIRHDI